MPRRYIQTSTRYATTTRPFKRKSRRLARQPVRVKRSRSVALRNMRTGGLLGIETKYLDTACIGFALPSPTACAGGEANPTVGCTGCLSAPAQGDSASQREGSKIVIRSCLIQGIVQVAAQADQTATDVVSHVYLALVQDMQTNGATLNSEDVFSNAGAQAVLASSPNRNMSYTQRFKVLKTKKIALRIPSITWDGTNLEQSGFHTPFKLSWKGVMPVSFTVGGTTADVANVTNNSLHLIAFCSNTGLAPNLNFNARVRFVG